MYQHLTKIITASALSVFLFACTPEDAGIPPGIIDPNDTLNATLSDTASIIAFIEKDDTLRTDVASLATLGSMNDPAFGITNASFYASCRIAQKLTNYGTNPTLDSVVLSLVYNSAYGNYKKFGGYQTAQVYEITQELLIAANNPDGYNSYSQITKNPVPIATHTFVPIFTKFKTQPEQLRIRLSNNLGQRFLDEDSLTVNNVKNILKGIYVTTSSQGMSPGQGAIMAFTLLSDFSRITVYFTDNLGNKRELVVLLGGSGTTAFNEFVHQYAPGGEVEAKLLQGENFDYTAQPNLFIQSLEGIRIKFKLPHIQDYMDSGQIAVNKAEIILPIDESQDLSVYQIPLLLTAYTLTDEGKIKIVKDFPYVYYAGTYDSKLKAYKIRLNQHVQDILNGVEPNKWIYLDVQVGTKVTNMARAVFHGPKHPTNPMKLNLVYTRLQTD